LRTVAVEIGNESLSVSDDGKEMFLKSMLEGAKHLTEQQAAEMLLDKFLLMPLR
jgi:hypothetical protein